MSLLVSPPSQARQGYYRDLAINSGLRGMEFVAKFANEDVSARDREKTSGNIFMSARMLYTEQFKRAWSTGSLMDAFGFAMGLGKGQGAFIQHMLMELLGEFDDYANGKLGHRGVGNGSVNRQLELNAYEAKLLYNFLTDPELANSIDVAQSISNWLNAFFKLDFAIVTDLYIGATFEQLDEAVSCLYWNSETTMWDVVARAGFITEALFQRDRHGKILGNVREIVQWWSVYQERVTGREKGGSMNVKYGDVLYADFCKVMMKAVQHAQAMLLEPTIEDEESHTLQEAEQCRVREARHWVGDFGTVSEIRPRYNPALAKVQTRLINASHSVTHRIPIMFVNFVSYGGLEFNLHKRLRQEGN